MDEFFWPMYLGPDFKELNAYLADHLPRMQVRGIVGKGLAISVFYEEVERAAEEEYKRMEQLEREATETSVSGCLEH